MGTAVGTARREGARGETGKGRGRDWTLLGCQGNGKEMSSAEGEAGEAPLQMEEKQAQSPIPTYDGASVTCPSCLWE